MFLNKQVHLLAQMIQKWLFKQNVICFTIFEMEKAKHYRGLRYTGVHIYKTSVHFTVYTFYIKK